MTDIQVTSAQVEQIANAFARTDHMNDREFRRTMVLETLNNWRYSLYSAEQQAIQAEAAEREAAAKALELAEAGDLEAGKRAWQALKVLRPNLDGTDTFEDLPHAKLLEYVTLAAGAVAEPAHVWRVGDKARVSATHEWVPSGGSRTHGRYPVGTEVVIEGLERENCGNLWVQSSEKLDRSLILAECLEPITEQHTHGVSIGDQVIITSKTKWTGYRGEEGVPTSLHGKIVTVTKLGSVADTHEVEVQGSGMAGGWRMLPDGLAKVFHGRDDWESGAKAVVTGPATYANGVTGDLELGDVVTLRNSNVDSDGDLYVRGENGKGPWVLASSVTRVIA